MIQTGNKPIEFFYFVNTDLTATRVTSYISLDSKKLNRIACA